MNKIRKALGLAAASALIGAGLAAGPAATEKAQAAYWCVASGTSYVPLMTNVGGSTSRNPVRVRSDSGNWHDVWKGQPKRLCPIAYWVHSSRDHRVQYSNGYWVIGVSYGEHSFGGVNCLARNKGGSGYFDYDEYWQ